MAERWLLVGAHDVEPARNGSALRIQQHVASLKRRGATVKYFKAAPSRTWANLSPAKKLGKAPGLLLGALTGIDPNCNLLYDQAIAQRLVATIRRFKPGHIVYCESWMVQYAKQVAREYYPFSWRQYLDLHNVEARLRLDSTFGLSRSKLMFRAESTMAKDCGEIWVCSEVDRANVRELYGVDAVVVPNKIDAGKYHGLSRAVERTFGMVGIWSYPPNSEAAKILLENVWPNVPDSTPVLVGKNPTRAMRESVKRGAVVLGEVEDTRPALARMRTVVVPLLKGGGTRLKVLEAMAAGIPVVATWKAVEGLEVEHLRDCIICEPHAMADWVQRLWDSPVLEESLSVNARALVGALYAW